MRRRRVLALRAARLLLLLLLLRGCGCGDGERRGGRNKDGAKHQKHSTAETLPSGPTRKLSRSGWKSWVTIMPGDMIRVCAGKVERSMLDAGAPTRRRNWLAWQTSAAVACEIFCGVALSWVSR